MAINNGRITAALTHSRSTTISVFSIVLTEEEIHEYQDYSCENMCNCAVEIPIEIVQTKKINRQDYGDSFVPSLGLLYLYCLGNNPYLNTEILSIQEEELLQKFYQDGLDDVINCLFAY